MSSAGLLRLAGLVSVAFGVLLVVTQLVGALAFVVLDGDPARRARSAWWLEVFAVPYAAAKAPAWVAEPPSGRLLAGAVVSFGGVAVGWVLFGVASLRARVFPRDAAILLVIGGGIGWLITVVPGAGAPLAPAVAWMGTWLLRSDRVAKSSWSLGGDAEPAGCCRPWRDRDRDRDRPRRPAGCLHALLRARPRGR
jgi:hypothetical protein